MAPTQINTRPVPPLPIVCDFGWWYGSQQEIVELSYTVNGVTYPPGVTTVAGSSVTLPASTIQVASTTSFEASGTIMFGALGVGGIPQSVVYTGKTATTFTGCTGGTGTYVIGTPVWDPRFYTNQTLLNQAIVFDAIDSIPLGLPKVIVPSGVSIISYQWDFGNGLQGYGPVASVTYAYLRAVPGLTVSLTVLDSRNRSYSCAKAIDPVSLPSRIAVGYQTRSGTARS